jgi:hypothetical protein
LKLGKVSHFLFLRDRKWLNFGKEQIFLNLMRVEIVEEMTE